MPYELVIPERQSIEFREYEESALEPDQVRVESEFSSNKHGTLFRKYRGDPNEWHSDFEREHRISQSEPSFPNYPLSVGNTTVGTVIDVGENVTEFGIGDRVFGHLPIRETHAVTTDHVRHAPAGMPAEAIVYRNPGGVGVHLIRDGDVSLGDTVAVFGAGAIGQITAQLCRLAGASTVVVSDPLERRRSVAARHGADLVIDPTETDAALEIKQQVVSGEEPGVDRALETSAAYAGLDDAIRAVAYGGTISSCGYYEGDASPLGLEAEFHRNAVDIRSVQPGSSNAMAYHPRWQRRHLRDEAFRHLEAGRIDVDGLIDPIVPLDEAAETIEHVIAHPEDAIKVGVTYD